MEEISHHPRVSDKMKMRCLLLNKDNVKTFALLQENFQLELDTLFYMGKMNLLHILLRHRVGQPSQGADLQPGNVS